MKQHTHKPMTCLLSVSNAVADHLDVAKANPEVMAMPVEDLEEYVENYVIKVIEGITGIIDDKGGDLLRSGNAGGLLLLLLESKIPVPVEQLAVITQAIVEDERQKVLWHVTSDSGEWFCVSIKVLAQNLEMDLENI